MELLDLENYKPLYPKWKKLSVVHLFLSNRKRGMLLTVREEEILFLKALTFYKLILTGHHK